MVYRLIWVRKSTLAKAPEKALDKGYNVYMLDVDNIRDGLNSNLGFSNEDRNEKEEGLVR